MKRNELWRSVFNVMERCGQTEELVVDHSMPLEDAVRNAAAVAFARNLTEDDDTRRLRWQCGDLVFKGHLTLED